MTGWTIFKHHKNLILKQSDFEKELNVVKEERRLRVDDRPISKAFEKTLFQLFGFDGYGIPIIGTMKDLNNITLDHVQEWYKNFYSPNNATLILAGDIDKIKIKKLIEKYFSPIKSQKIALNLQRKEKTDMNFEDIQLKENISNPTKLISFIKHLTHISNIRYIPRLNWLIKLNTIIKH